MAATSETILINHEQQQQQQRGLFGEEEQEEMGNTSQMGFFSFHPNMNYPPPPPSSSHHQPLSIKGSSIYTIPSSSSSSFLSANNLTPQTLLSSSPPPTPKQREEMMMISSDHDFGGPYLLSLQRSNANLWAWGGEVNDLSMSSKRSSTTRGEDHHQQQQQQHLGVSSVKMKKMKGRRKVREPRFCFKTMSDVDVLDDGYKWRKYGQKVVKNTQHPRSYYRCTQDNCRVKKRVERLAEDPRMVITSYEGRHAHSPSHDLEDSSSQSPSHHHLNNFFF